MNFKNLPQLLNYFKDEKTAVEYFEQQRWGGNVVCPHCGHDKVYRTTRGYKCASKTCYKKFTVKVGTIFEDSKISLRIWFAAIYICSAHKKGISSCQLARDLNITQKTAWFVLHRVRAMLKSEAPFMIKTVYQADETFIGGKNKNRHADKKVKESQGRSVKDKTPVLGMVKQSDGTVITRVIPDTKAKTLKPIINELVKEGSILVTDEWPAYNSIRDKYDHVVVNHKSGEYVRGVYHTNSVEGFWAILKRGIYGIYHYASPQHLHAYCNEFAYRYNSRKITDLERFDRVLTHTQGRLTYKNLIASKSPKVDNNLDAHS